MHALALSVVFGATLSERAMALSNERCGRSSSGDASRVCCASSGSPLDPKIVGDAHVYVLPIWLAKPWHFDHFQECEHAKHDTSSPIRHIRGHFYSFFGRVSSRPFIIYI